MEKLKPCPFCGRKVTVEYWSEDKAFAFWHRGNAEPCFIEPIWLSVDKAKSLKEAADFWNRRAEGSEDEAD